MIDDEKNEENISTSNERKHKNAVKWVMRKLLRKVVKFNKLK